MFYDLFLVGYINGLQSYLHESENKPRQFGNRVVSTPQWRQALKHAKVGLLRARKAHELMERGQLEEAEDMASSGVEYVKDRSVLILPSPQITMV